MKRLNARLRSRLAAASPQAGKAHLADLSLRRKQKFIFSVGSDGTSPKFCAMRSYSVGIETLYTH